MFFTLLFSFTFASISLYILHPVAMRISFVDRPTERKQHKGDIPLIGGLSIFLPVAVTLYFSPELVSDNQVYLFCSAFLLLLGMIDDKLDLSVKLRMTLIIAVSAWLVLEQGFKIDYLGDLLGSGDVLLGNFDILFTIVAIIGAVTAFNMVDGLDGLLGGLAIVTISALAILFAINQQYQLLLFCYVFIISIIPYIICNLGLLPKKKLKVFMGDSGSLFIGFTVIWLLIEGSQNYEDSQMMNKINPVTALWIIAIPLMDMAYTMIRRIRKKQSPFKADREHIHHVCERLGLSSLQTLALICFIACIFATIGVIGELLNISEVVMFTAFIITFIGYHLFFTHIWRVTVFVRHCASLLK